MAFLMGLPWSDGEQEIHRLLKVPEYDNPTSTALNPQGAYMLQQAPLLAVGTLDTSGRPWTTVWGGEPGLSRPLGGSVIGLRTAVDKQNDPVVQILVGNKPEGEVVQEEGRGRMVSFLAIKPMTRQRVKLYGRMLAGAVNVAGEEGAESDIQSHSSTQGEIQLVERIEQTLGG
jgi:hypothetical protein